MIFYVAGRQQGKSTKLLQWMMEAPDEERIILCSDRNRKQHLERLLRKMYPDQDMRRFFIRIQVIDYSPGPPRGARYDVKIGIDDLDSILTLMWSRVEFVTATGVIFGG